MEELNLRGSAAEAGRLESVGPGRFVPTQEALAAQLGVNRKSIERWLKKEGCPGSTEHGYDVKAWDAWCTANRLGRKTKAASKLANLEEQKLILENEKRALINAKLRGESMHVDEVCQVLGEMMSGFVLQLRQGVHTMADESVGVPAGEAAKRIRHRLDETMRSLSLGEWAKKKIFWSTVYARLFDLLATYDLGPGPKSTFGMLSATSGGPATTPASSGS